MVMSTAYSPQIVQGSLMNVLEETAVSCPCCGENFTTLVDISAGNQQYIEDCQICCCPILFEIELDTGGGLQQVITRRENE